MQDIGTCLWFDNQAEEAASFYVSVFAALKGGEGEHTKVLHVARYSEEAAKTAGRPAGSVMTVTFRLHGRGFMALNGGPLFQLTPAISFMVNCETQQEIDDLWEKLSEGGKKERCGWLQDKYGVSWQIVPAVLGKLMRDQDSDRPRRVMQALLKMDKLDIKGLEQA